MENRHNNKKAIKLKAPLVCVIIINWNGIKNTLECLRSLMKINYKNFQVVVVDNGSKDDQIQTIRKKYPKIKNINNKINEGFCKANNQGILLSIKSGAKYSLILNNDTIVHKNFLTELVHYYEDHNFKGALSPKILFHQTKTIWSMGGLIDSLTSIPRMIGQGKSSEKFQQVYKPGFLTGCALFSSNEIFMKVGLLDEDYFAYYEDVDFCRRVVQAGYQLVTIPKSIVWHRVSKSTKNKSAFKIGPTQSYLLARNGIVFGDKRLKGFQKRLYLAKQFIIKLPLFLLFKVDSLRSAFAYLWGIVDGITYVYTKKLNEKNLNKFLNA